MLPRMEQLQEDSPWQLCSSLSRCSSTLPPRQDLLPCSTQHPAPCTARRRKMEEGEGEGFFFYPQCDFQSCRSRCRLTCGYTAGMPWAAAWPGQAGAGPSLAKGRARFSEASGGRS